MSDIGNLLDRHDGAFSALEDTLTLRHYVSASGQKDEYGDPTGGSDGDRNLHATEETTGSLDLQGRPSVELSAYNTDIEADAVGWIDDSAFVTSGGGTHPDGTTIPYPTEVEYRGTTFTVVHRFDEGNGTIRCLVRSEDN